MNKIILTLLLTFPAISFAQMECKNDGDRLCGDLETRTEKTACLLLNKNKINSLECKKRISNQSQAAYRLCLADYHKLCEKKYPASLSAAYTCLMKNRSSLTKACKDLLPTQ